MMPTRADWEASVPKCDRIVGDLTHRHACSWPLRWLMTDIVGGRWTCLMHGPVMSGREAAERAGFTEPQEVEAA